MITTSLMGQMASMGWNVRDVWQGGATNTLSGTAYMQYQALENARAQERLYQLFPMPAPVMHESKNKTPYEKLSDEINEWCGGILDKY